MSLPVLILTRKLLVGGLAYNPSTPPPPPPPPDPDFGIASGFSVVDVDPLVGVSASFTIYRNNGDETATDYSLTWTMVPPAFNPVTAAYLADAGYLSGKVVTFAAGQQSKVVSVNFAAHADPAASLSASIVLSAPSHGVVDPSAASFTFSIPQAVVGPVADYDMGPAAAFAANWTVQKGNSVPMLTQEDDGVVLDCSADQTNQDSNFMLWAKMALPDKANNGWTLTYSYTQLDTNLATQSGGVFAHLYPGVTGGRNSASANPNLWTTGEYQDALITVGKGSRPVINKYGSGLRFSWDQDALTVANSDQLRGHQMLTDGTEGNLGGVSYAAAFLFDANVEYRISVAYKPVASQLVWTKTKVSDNTVETVTVTDAEISTNIGTYLGFGVNSGRKCRIRLVVLTVDPLDGPPPPPPPPPGNKPWEDDATQWATLPATFGAISAPSKITIASNSDLTKLASAAPGDVFVITGDLTGSVTMTNRAGTKANPIIICGDTWSTNLASMRKWTATGSTNLRIMGCSHVYVMRMQWVGGTNVQDGNIFVGGSSDHISIERNWSYGAFGDNGLEIPFVRIDSKSPVRYWRLRYNAHGGNATDRTCGAILRFGTTNPYPAHPKFGWFYQNHIRNIEGRTKAESPSVVYSACAIMSGNNPDDGVEDYQASMYKNLFDSCLHIGEGIEFKNSGWTVADNTFLQDASGDLWSVRIRQGTNNTIVGNLFVSLPGNPGKCGDIQLRGRGHHVHNNWGVRMAAGGPLNTSTPLSTATISVNGGQVDAVRLPDSADQFKSHPPAGADPPTSPRPQCDGVKVGGNRMIVNIGAANAVYVPPLGATNCIVPKATSRPDRNETVNLDTLGDKMYAGHGKTYAEFGGSVAAYGAKSGTGTTDYTTNLTLDGASYDTVPLLMLQADVGPTAP